MPNQDWSPGRPFPGDYPDTRTSLQRDQEVGAVRRNVADLTRRARDSEFLAGQITMVQRRRERRNDLLRLLPVPAVPERATPQGFETIAVAGELLVRRETLDALEVRQVLDPHGFSEVPVDCLDGRVVRLVNPAVDVDQLSSVARQLHQLGHPGSVNHVTPLGAIIKGLGGPAPSVGGPPFTAGAGSGMQVAVIDTGITAEVRADGWLKDTPRDGNIDLLDALPDGPNGFLDLGAGHGTFTAGVVQQVASGADIRVYRAVDGDGIGSEVDVACAMVQAVRDGARVLNLSLGTQTLDDQPPVALQVALEIIGEIEQETGEQVLVVAAAGNYGNTRPCWPAAFRRVVAVAGLTAAGQSTEWSNRGFWVDCSAVGEGVMSTYVEGTEPPELGPDADSYGANAWAVWTGTSFAAPQIAGAVARLCDELGMKPQEALGELLRRGRMVPDFGCALQILPGT